MKVRDRKSCSAADHASDDEARHQHAERQIDAAEMEARADIDGVDETVIDAEDQDESDLGDEQDAEEEGEAAQRLVAAPLEGQVIDLIDRGAEQVEEPA